VKVLVSGGVLTPADDRGDDEAPPVTEGADELPVPHAPAKDPVTATTATREIVIIRTRIDADCTGIGGAEFVYVLLSSVFLRVLWACTAAESLAGPAGSTLRSAPVQERPRARQMAQCVTKSGIGLATTARRPYSRGGRSETRRVAVDLEACADAVGAVARAGGGGTVRWPVAS
jgi:hypothetical protein